MILRKSPDLEGKENVNNPLSGGRNASPQTLTAKQVDSKESERGAPGGIIYYLEYC